jgi:hypothetical protein
MNAFDLVLWAAAWWLFARLLHEPGRSTRRWLALGLVLGLALETKIGVLALGLGLLVGLVLGRRAAVLRTPGPWLAAALALALFVPHLAWQVQHGWPTLEFMHNARVHKMEHVAPLGWLVGQVMQLDPFAAPVWLAGLFWLLRSPRERPLALAFLTVALVMLVGGGKSYYTVPAYLPLFAAGGVAVATWPRALRVAVPALVVVGGLIGLPMAKPILPIDAYLRYQAALGHEPGTGGERHEKGRLPQFFADMHGWQELVDEVARVHDALPEEDRRVACVFASDYGQAGAIDVLGRAHRLPPAISGHNNYWLWGPRGCTGEVVLVLGGERARLEEVFERVEQAGTFVCAGDLCMPYENHLPIWVGRKPRVPMARLWPGLKHYE